MSRIGKKPIILPEGVSFANKDNLVTITGPKGTLSVEVNHKVTVNQDGNSVVVDITHQTNKKERSMWGTYRAILSHMVSGVTTGHTKELDVVGVGYKVELQGKKLVMALGFSHPVTFEVPPSVDIKAEKIPTKTGTQHYQSTLTLSGADKQLVGQVAANIRRLKEPESYKGKGIRYSGEKIIIKPGKVMKAVGK